MTKKVFNAENFLSVLLSKKFDVRKPISFAEKLFDESITDYTSLFESAKSYFKNEEVAVRVCTVLVESNFIGSKETKDILASISILV